MAEEQLSLIPFQQVLDWNQLIRARFLARAVRAKVVNFREICLTDLQLLFELYDEHCFARLFKRQISGKITFAFSARMTSAGAKVTFFKSGVYRLTVSSHLLFHGFKDGGEPVQVNGVVCQDRLAVLQRLVEHEMTHLYELVTFGNSSCKQERFKELANSRFGHQETTHRLVTARQRAHTELGLRVGDKVAFTFEGQRLSGILNRITKRATVLVSHPRGKLRDKQGNRYMRYYVPVGMLDKQ